MTKPQSTMIMAIPPVSKTAEILTALAELSDILTPLNEGRISPAPMNRKHARKHALPGVRALAMNMHALQCSVNSIQARSDTTRFAVLDSGRLTAVLNRGMAADCRTLVRTFYTHSPAYARHLNVTTTAWRRYAKQLNDNVLASTAFLAISPTWGAQSRILRQQADLAFESFKNSTADLKKQSKTLSARYALAAGTDPALWTMDVWGKYARRAMVDAERHKDIAKDLIEIGASMAVLMGRESSERESIKLVFNAAKGMIKTARVNLAMAGMLGRGIENAQKTGVPVFAVK